MTAYVWRMSRQGRPERSLKIFAGFVWLMMTGLTFFGLPPVTLAIAMAVAIMLCVVISQRAGGVFVGAFMASWLAYIVLSKFGLAPQTYFINRPITSWVITAFAVWLILLPLPALVKVLRRSISLQRATLESTAEGVLVIANDGTIETCNRRFLDMCHIPADVLASESAGPLIMAIGDQLANPEKLTETNQYLSASPEASSRVILQAKDGHVFELTTMPQYLDGQVVGRVWSFRDITDSKRTEDELRISATAFESQEAIVITDANNCILRVNRAFSETTGYASQDVIGKTPDLWKSGRHDASFYSAIHESVRLSGAWQGEVWDRRKNGEIYPNWTTITAVKKGDGEVTHYVATQTDITQRKSAEEEIRHLAFYDPLTQLPNRRLLMDRLRHALSSSSRSGREGALMFIDLDNFKILNDTLGHDHGDELLRQVADRLPLCVRDSDTVARLGGDEFVVMLEELSSNPKEAAIQAETVGEKILAGLNKPYNLIRQKFHCTPSIGVALFADHKNSIEEVMKRADLAMYQAKAAGRNCVRFFDPKMQAVVAAHAALEEELRQALVKQEFRVYCQPQVDNTGRIVGAEALVRWQHPVRGMVSPAEFIPLSEQTAIILPLGQWVLETACQALVSWARIPDLAHVTLAVNVSARQFRQPAFVDQVMCILEQTGANPERLKLELTESLLLDDMEDVILKMSSLKANGVGFSLDDFGTGYSSLSYLKRLPLDQLKIDRSFVRDVMTDPNDAVIARTIIALGQSLGLAVIAEGVENDEQWAFLKTHGCLAYQGYLFGRPMPIEEFTREVIAV
ncbi:MAG: EAL domain-containing protein [Burkholderiales bacterium]|nr:EAL domain-containing protein [Burkholderiales bacterium]